MKNEDQNIAVAKFMGYRFVDEGHRYPDEENWQKYKAVYAPNGGGFIGLCKPEWTQIPDYGEDLNAMNQVEMMLDDARLGGVYDNFELHLAEICYQEGWKRNMIAASASQRREALLRTLNLWTGE